MKRIEVKNFIVLKEAIYEPKRFNVIIGPQATGKSLLVKLEYFFNEAINQLKNITFWMLNKTEICEAYIESIKKLFIYYFDKNIINNYNFTIKYIINDIEIIIEKENILNVLINENLKNHIKNIEQEYKNISKIKNNDNIFSNLDFFIEIGKKHNFMLNYTYIPAGRTYFSMLSSSIFTHLKNNSTIDPFLLSFGSQYELHQEVFQSQINNHKTYIKKKLNKIIKGDIKYSIKEKSLGIEKNKIFTKISLLSSGQQEILPLVVVLLDTMSQYKNYIIEEPEAHLYPNSQKELIELIAYVYNQGSSISITTHSPYIITTINNLLLLDEKKDKISKDNPLFEKLDYKISSKDLSAYTIEDGVLKNIYDKENNLIDAYTIDSVSEELSQEFNELLEL